MIELENMYLTDTDEPVIGEKILDEDDYTIKGKLTIDIGQGTAIFESDDHRLDFTNVSFTLTENNNVIHTVIIEEETDIWVFKHIDEV